MRPTNVLVDAWQGLRRNKSIAISVVLVTMISMYLLGVGVLAQRQVTTMKGYWYDRVQVSIYLCTDSSSQPNCAEGAVTDEQRETIEAQLEESRPLVKEVYFESEQEAYDRFREDYKNSPLSKNIRVGDIPPSYRVQLSDPEQYETVASAFENAPGVASVPDLRQVFSKLFQAINIASAVMVALSLLTLVSAVLLMATTIRQAAFTRRREIAIMKLVGASNSTIRTPFIIETLVAGLVGTGLAVGMLWFSAWSLFDEYLIQETTGTALISSSEVLVIAPALFGLVGVLAIGTSTITLWRYLRV
ncbi:FtsX-like permease family protein [Janibacter melonis]|uniref:Cell division protein FtsX n=2 Tax=Bacteria TaxID=2 RepID=A0A5P8FKM4_9MICO|nr:permease-like cell division protein FtsX [Janibacter melonis]MCB5992834.1 permease-like cell division protein FtsX [Janibacter melonis]QFQ29743.2 FtsX-like permease family protein [Janibacter melonis]